MFSFLLTLFKARLFLAEKRGVFSEFYGIVGKELDKGKSLFFAIYPFFREKKYMASTLTRRKLLVAREKKPLVPRVEAPKPRLH